MLVEEYLEDIKKRRARVQCSCGVTAGWHMFARKWAIAKSKDGESCILICPSCIKEIEVHNDKKQHSLLEEGKEAEQEVHNEGTGDKENETDRVVQT